MTAGSSRYVEDVAAIFIEKLKAGTAPWLKPWAPGETPVGACNAITEKPYRGLNRIYLGMIQPDDDPRWCTLKQANSVGARVRKGSRGTVIRFTKTADRELIRTEDGQPALDGEGRKRYRETRLARPKIFHAFVFHASQIEGLPERGQSPPRERDWEPVEEAQRFLRASGADIRHDQRDSAFYRPSTDSIHLPPLENFRDAAAHAATALHELGHWTGHPSRLDRQFGRHGDPEYAREELRAEIASWMLGTELGVGHDPSQAAAYVADWIGALEDDPTEVYAATRDADRIVRYLNGLAREQSQEQSAVDENRTRQAPPNPAAAKTAIEVPFSEKDDAKRLGARWDRAARTWYVPEGVDLAPFGRWRNAPRLSPQEEFGEFLRSAAGLVLPGAPIMDGEMHRVPVDGGRPGALDGTYAGHLDGRPAGWARNWKSGFDGKWISRQAIDRETAAGLAEEAAGNAARRAAERAAAYEAAADAVADAVAALPPAPADHPYLAGKGLRGGFGARIDERGNLVVPLADADGKVWSAQRIGSDGRKGLEKGARASGAFHVIGDLPEGAGDLLLATGFGTGAAIHAATGAPVACAISDANLCAVARALKERCPERRIVVLGDDDRHLPDRTPPMPNGGREKAAAAARAVEGIAVFPEFEQGEYGPKFTDFADVLRTRGMEEVARQVERGLGADRSAVRSRGRGPDDRDRERTRNRAAGLSL